MIARLAGRIVEKTAGAVVVDVRGVGYLVHVPATAFRRLPQAGEETELHIRTIVREDSIALYGFRERRERDVFDLLITVTGVGPKVAIAILSGLEFANLARAIVSEDAIMLSKAPGVGKKTAERVILELKDKMTFIAEDAQITAAEHTPAPYMDALSALLNLGYTRVEASRALERALKELGRDAELEKIVSHGLKLLGRM
ncbi:Holliday junction branch migration protein RuvA [bacterium]|nr:Holliday junction branch migration protein RuvA [bacterium]